MPVHKPETQSEHNGKFRRGLEQFNARKFFDAHESWEEIWLSSPEPHKTFLQGIIQISAAFHHYTCGNMQGTRSLLEAGLRRVGLFPAQYSGIHLELLREAARVWIAALAAGGDPGSEKVPRIDLSDDVQPPAN
jgi:predicted metal-dependent hydrolase